MIQEIILLITGVVFGGLAMFLWFKSRTQHPVSLQQYRSIESALQSSKEKIASLQAQVQSKNEALEEVKSNYKQVESQKIQLENQLTQSQTENRHLQEKLQHERKEMEKVEQKFLEQFESISRKVLRQNADEFKKTSNESLENTLKPLQEKIKNFEQKVDHTYKDTLKDSSELKAQIKELQKMHQTMSEDARRLTEALKGDKKMQGNWGEMILTNLLERSGLKEGEEFRREASYSGENGQTYRPDVIIDLPDQKHLIIDSKVSLANYSAYINAEDETLQNHYLKEFTNNMYQHIKSLSNKHYHSLDGLNSPDFVLMFLPIEPAFSLAMQHDGNLFMDALDKNIVIVTPSTLLATLRTVASIWKQENQKRNVLEIAEESGKMYDKFVNFVEDLKNVGEHLDKSSKSYEAAMNKLSTGRGNLVQKAEKLKGLGAKASKQLTISNE